MKQSPHEPGVKGFLRRTLSSREMEWLIRTAIFLQGIGNYPWNRILGARARKNGRDSAPGSSSLEHISRRMMSYNVELLPNRYLAEMDRGMTDLDSAKQKTGLTIGYPAWNLLYFAVLCSLPAEKNCVVVETGTNRGISTILLAQALKDAGVASVVQTVDIDPDVVRIAQENVARAGLSEYVKFHVEDSHAFLLRFVKENSEVHFAFLDGNHTYRHVRKEFDILYPAIVAGRGSAYFDNTAAGGVFRALLYIRRAYPGNLVEFLNCSWNPPGNAIWQPK
jgi:predicted O-methyltransferase YrrM